MKRRNFQFCGKKLNLAVDYYVGIAWFAVIIFGNIFNTIFVIYGDALTNNGNPLVINILWIITLYFSYRAVIMLWRTWTRDPGFITNEEGEAYYEEVFGYLAKIQEHWPPQYQYWRWNEEEREKRKQFGSKFGLKTDDTSCMPTTEVPEAETEWEPLLVAPPPMHRLGPNEWKNVPHRCPVNDLYVRRYDHHCGVIGACIGERNMGTFIHFLLSVALLDFCGWVNLVMSLYYFLPSNAIMRNTYNQAGFFAVVSKYMLNPTFVVTFGLIIITFWTGCYTFLLTLIYSRSVLKGEDSSEIRREIQAVKLARVPEEPRRRNGRENMWNVLSHVERGQGAYERLVEIGLIKTGAQAGQADTMV